MARTPMRRIVEHLRAGSDRSLADVDPRATPGCKDKGEALRRIEQNLARIDTLQYGLHAEGKRALLLVLQGMDTAGKDGVIRKVMTAFNPQGCRVVSFKVPTPEEAAHDFLWRVWKVTPARGEVVIFNRSHYEDVLVVRVHDLVPEAVWSKRYETINQFERQLTDSGTTVLKFFLHISRDEQRERLLERLDDPAKHWKFNAGDLDERARWKDYQRAYHDALTRCGTAHAPWYVIPADRKWYRDLAISEIVADALAKMDPRPPKVKLDVKAMKERLARD